MTASYPTILVTGANGQVGRALLKSLENVGKIIPADLGQLDPQIPVTKVDFASAESVLALMRHTNPDIVVNPAAYTAVDKAEKEHELCMHINAVAPGLIAAECSRRGIPLIHYSTDYVFSGLGNAPRDEQEPTGPLNFYGESKLQGERAIIEAGGNFVILRTSWVFSDHGQNFVKTMLKLGAEREELRIVEDQIGAPTSAQFLADQTKRVIKFGQLKGFNQASGLYHLCNSGETSWYEFAKEIFELAKIQGKKVAVKKIIPIKSVEYQTPAQRPINSRLNCSKYCVRFGVTELQSWKEALTEVMLNLNDKPQDML